MQVYNSILNEYNICYDLDSDAFTRDIYAGYLELEDKADEEYQVDELTTETQQILNELSASKVLNNDHYNFVYEQEDVAQMESILCSHYSFYLSIEYQQVHEDKRLALRKCCNILKIIPNNSPQSEPLHNTIQDFVHNMAKGQNPSPAYCNLLATGSVNFKVNHTLPMHVIPIQRE